MELTMPISNVVCRVSPLPCARKAHLFLTACIGNATILAIPCLYLISLSHKIEKPNIQTKSNPMTPTLKSAAYFATFTEAFNNFAIDYDAVIDLFAEDAKLEYIFAGLPNNKGDRNAVHEGFKTILKTFHVCNKYIGGTDHQCMYSWSAYFETTLGQGAVYTGNGYLQFNEDDKIINYLVVSDDSQEFAKCVMAAMEAAQKGEASSEADDSRCVYIIKLNKN